MRLIKWLSGLLLSTCLAVAGWLWLTMLSPFMYDRPEHLESVAEGPHRVFVYGTLRYAIVRWVVMGRAGETQPATLDGFQRDALDIVESPQGSVGGKIITVSADELSRLDRYERLGLRYERVRLDLTDGREAWVYRRLEAAASEASAL
ncbi:MAG TPA: gamma-glutamylcyclotransferase family protein [Halomonas sp.]|nr:gamma-glutamylcyclotransferase family protein [Halomonas sp.]